MYTAFFLSSQNVPAAAFLCHCNFECEKRERETMNKWETTQETDQRSLVRQERQERGESKKCIHLKNKFGSFLLYSRIERRSDMRLTGPASLLSPDSLLFSPSWLRLPLLFSNEFYFIKVDGPWKSHLVRQTDLAVELREKRVKVKAKDQRVSLFYSFLFVKTGKRWRRRIHVPTSRREKRSFFSHSATFSREEEFESSSCLCLNTFDKSRHRITLEWNGQREKKGNDMNVRWYFAKDWKWFLFPLSFSLSFPVTWLSRRDSVQTLCVREGITEQQIPFPSVSLLLNPFL